MTTTAAYSAFNYTTTIYASPTTTAAASILYNLTTAAPLANVTTTPAESIGDVINTFLNTLYALYYGANGGFPWGFLMMALLIDIFVIGYFVCNKRILAWFVSLFLNYVILPRDEGKALVVEAYLS